MTRTSSLLIALILAMAACAAPVGDAGPITTRPPATDVQGGDTTTTTTAPVTTTTTTAPADEPTETTRPATDDRMDVVVYFLLEEAEPREPRTGPHLVPVHRRVDRTVGVAGAAITALLAGPTPAEASATPSISTAVPEGTVLLGIDIADGLATVDLSREFESGGGTFSMTARLAQVVYTLTRFPTVDRVAFHLDGEPVEVFSGEGILLEEPVSRDDYLDLLPLVFVDHPAWGAPAGNPARATGIANVFEATFQLALLDRDGTTLYEHFVTATCGTGCWGDFDVTVPYRVDEEQPGTLRVWTDSPEDGSRRDLREHPVRLSPEES